MRVRQLIEIRKVLNSETPWSDSDMPPRHAPIYSKTRPTKAGWRWRSAKVSAGSFNFVLVALCNVRRDNWKAILILERPDGASAVGRFEYHGSHPGLHCHSNCERSGLERSAKSLDNLDRYPKVGSFHRRQNAWTEGTFWGAAKRFFRVERSAGPLFDDVP